MEVKGTIKFIADLVQVTDTFRKQEFHLEIPGEFPQVCNFQCANNRCDQLAKLNEGDNVEVFFNLRGRETNGKVWNTLDCWKVIKTN